MFGTFCFNLIVFKEYRFLIAVAFKTNPSSVYRSVYPSLLFLVL